MANMLKRNDYLNYRNEVSPKTYLNKPYEQLLEAALEYDSRPHQVVNLTGSIIKIYGRNYIKRMLGGGRTAAHAQSDVQPSIITGLPRFEPINQNRINDEIFYEQQRRKQAEYNATISELIVPEELSDSWSKLTPQNYNKIFNHRRGLIDAYLACYDASKIERVKFIMSNYVSAGAYLSFLDINPEDMTTSQKYIYEDIVKFYGDAYSKQRENELLQITELNRNMQTSILAKHSHSSDASAVAPGLNQTVNIEPDELVTTTNHKVSSHTINEAQMRADPNMEFVKNNDFLTAEPITSQHDQRFIQQPIAGKYTSVNKTPLTNIKLMTPFQAQKQTSFVSNVANPNVEQNIYSATSVLQKPINPNSNQQVINDVPHVNIQNDTPVYPKSQYAAQPSLFEQPWENTPVTNASTPVASVTNNISNEAATWHAAPQPLPSLSHTPSINQSQFINTQGTYANQNSQYTVLPKTQFDNVYNVPECYNIADLINARSFAKQQNNSLINAIVVNQINTNNEIVNHAIGAQNNNNVKAKRTFASNYR